MALRQDAGWFVGEDVILEFTLQGSGDVTGWAFAWSLTKEEDSVTSLVSKTTGNGGAFVSDGPGRKVRVTVASGDTNNASVGQGAFYHHLRRTDPGQNTVFAYGVVTLAP